MTCSTSSSNRSRIACGLLALLVLPGCALLRGRAGSPLEFDSLTPEGEGPAVAHSSTIRWTAVAKGGTGKRTYEFKTLRGSTEIVEQVGPSPTWDWDPPKAGTFRVKVTVEDSAGARVDSAWSPEIVVLPREKFSNLIAVLPADNLTGGRAPLQTVDRMLREKLEERGFRLLEDDVLEAFMKQHRVRQTGSVGSPVFLGVKEETGAEAVLLTSLETFQEADPPKVALFSRLVSSGDRPEIEWAEGVGLAGDGAPGLLALGRIDDPEVLLGRAVNCLADSLERSFSQTGQTSPAASRNRVNECNIRGEVVASSLEEKGSPRHRPQSFFRSPIIDSERRYSVAVIPFLNLSERRNAGKILAFHFVDQMLRNDFLTVIEPGLVIEQLLKYRIVMEAGPSDANAEILSSPRSLGADLVLSGTVFDYQDSIGVPKVGFTVKVFEKTSRRVVWSSRSENDGAEGVFFFGMGTVHTAHQLASEMVRGTFEAWNE